MKRIGVAGIGIMGAGMASSLLRNGFRVTLWNRSRAKCDPLVDLGATVASSPESLASESDVVVSVLRDDFVVREVLIDQMLPGVKSGTTFIDMSTVTPGLARRAASACESRGCNFLDAPVMGSKEAAAAGELTILVGGSSETLEAQRDVLSALGQRIIHVGPNGSSAYLKLACNQLVAGVMAAIGEGIALARQGDVDRTTAVEMFTSTLSRVAGMKHPKIANQDWSTHFALDLMLKDLRQAQEAASESQLGMPVLSAVAEVYRQLQGQGRGALDFSVVTDPNNS